jgi:hypothetical protein
MDISPALSDAEAELAPFAVEYSLQLDDEAYRITRFDNHRQLIPEGRWAVVWHNEFYLCRGKWEYKNYQGFDSAGEALVALRQHPR